MLFSKSAFQIQRVNRWNVSDRAFLHNTVRGRGRHPGTGTTRTGVSVYRQGCFGQAHAWMVGILSVSGLEVPSSAWTGNGNVRLVRTAGVFTTLLSDGAAIYGGQYRCSLGFNVVSGSTYYFLTAGHCGSLVKTWYTNSGHTTLIGPTVSFTFPGSDYALVRYDNTSLSHPGGFTVADPVVGESVKRTGSTSGTHSGTVTALNVTVRYSGHPGGTVRGLIQTNVCAEPGDSGGPLYDGSKALGLTSGGSGDCTSGGTTFFQPVRAAANAYGVTIY